MPYNQAIGTPLRSDSARCRRVRISSMLASFLAASATSVLTLSSSVWTRLASFAAASADGALAALAVASKVVTRSASVIIGSSFNRDCPASAAGGFSSTFAFADAALAASFGTAACSSFFSGGGGATFGSTFGAALATGAGLGVAFLTTTDRGLAAAGGRLAI